MKLYLLQFCIVVLLPSFGELEEFPDYLSQESRYKVEAKPTPYVPPNFSSDMIEDSFAPTPIIDVTTYRPYGFENRKYIRTFIKEKKPNSRVYYKVQKNHGNTPKLKKILRKKKNPLRSQNTSYLPYGTKKTLIVTPSPYTSDVFSKPKGQKAFLSSESPFLSSKYDVQNSLGDFSSSSDQKQDIDINSNLKAPSSPGLNEEENKYVPESSFEEGHLLKKEFLSEKDHNTGFSYSLPLQSNIKQLLPLSPFSQDDSSSQKNYSFLNLLPLDTEEKNDDKSLDSIKREILKVSKEKNENDYTSIPYSFSYGVRDERSGTDFERKEEKKGGVTFGSYRTALPDGRIQIVDYVADENGYKANVSYNGQAYYPSSNSFFLSSPSSKESFIDDESRENDKSSSYFSSSSLSKDSSIVKSLPEKKYTNQKKSF